VLPALFLTRGEIGLNWSRIEGALPCPFGEESSPKRDAEGVDPTPDSLPQGGGERESVRGDMDATENRHALVSG
jgi:hypothetical protein